MRATLAYTAAAAVAFALWGLTGNIVWVDQFFKLPSAILLVLLSGLQLWLCLQVCAEFSPGEPMRLAWQLIGASAAFDLAGTIGIQFLSTFVALKPPVASVWAASHVLQGTCRFALLATGLFCVLRLYRESGFLGRLRLRDWALVAAFAAYCVREARDLFAALHQGKHPAWGEISLWPVDPTLCLLLAEAILLHRSVQRTGDGLIGRCWRTYSAGVCLILMGDAIVWAEAYGYLPWPWNSVGWYVWMPAAAAFALAPAYQLEAIRSASSAR